MVKHPVAARRLLGALFAFISLTQLMGCDSQGRVSTTADDLQEQLSRQFIQQWTPGGFQSIEIDHFEKPSAENELVIGVGIRWDQQNSSWTSMTLYRAAERYYVGTFRLNTDTLPPQLQERAKLLRPVRILLSFIGGSA